MAYSDAYECQGAGHTQMDDALIDTGVMNAPTPSSFIQSIAQHDRDTLDQFIHQQQHNDHSTHNRDDMDDIDDLDDMDVPDHILNRIREQHINQLNKCINNSNISEPVRVLSALKLIEPNQFDEAVKCASRIHIHTHIHIHIYMHRHTFIDVHILILVDMDYKFVYVVRNEYEFDHE